MAEVGRRQAQALAPLLVLASVALMGLLAFNLRNLDPGAEELPPLPEIGGAPGVNAAEGSGTALRAMYVTTLLMLAILILVGSVVMYRRGVKVWKLFSVWELLGYTLAMVLLVVVFLWWPQINAGLQSFIEWVGRWRNPGEGGVGAPSPLPIGTSPPTVVLITAVAIVSAYAIVFAYRFLPRLYEVVTYEAPEPGRARRALAKAVRTAIADLEAGQDFRDAVLRCYKSMVLLFEAHGMRSEASQTAREFEADALKSVGVSREGIDDLTSLFEEARYSRHAIGEPQRDRAITCLSTIRTQLEGSA